MPAWTAFAVTNLLERHFGHLVDYGFTATMEEALDDEGMAQTVNFGTKDTPEAIMAFVEKRAPRFQGR